MTVISLQNLCHQITKLERILYRPNTVEICNGTLLRKYPTNLHHQQSNPHLILKVPDTILVRELVAGGTALWQDATLEATHVEEQVRVVLAVDRDEALLPHEGGDGTRKTILHVPEDSSSPEEEEENGFIHWTIETTALLLK